MSYHWWTVCLEYNVKGDMNDPRFLYLTERATSAGIAMSGAESQIKRISCEGFFYRVVSVIQTPHPDMDL